MLLTLRTAFRLKLSVAESSRVGPFTATARRYAGRKDQEQEDGAWGEQRKAGPRSPQPGGTGHETLTLSSSLLSPLSWMMRLR